jgi:hypothetical protein
VRARALLLVAALAVAAAGCGDDGGSEATADTGVVGPTTPTTGTVAGPTDATVACSDLAERYVRRARVMFETEGTPSDQLVDRTRTRLMEFDQIAAAAGCGAEYTQGVCDGLDDLAHEGVLVILPLTTASCL